MTNQKTIIERLRRIALVTCGTALIVACFCLFVFQMYTVRETFIRNTKALAIGVATSSSVVLEAEDRSAAENTLAPLSAQPNMLTAAFLYPDHRPFFVLGSSEELSAQETRDLQQGYAFHGLKLIVKQPVLGTNETVGHLLLISDFGAELLAQSKRSGLILACVIVCSLFIATKLSIRMQRVITVPLERLAATANLVAEKRDYSVRAEKLANDEFGVLTDAFNQMLQQIHTQANTISAAHEFQSDQLDQMRKEINERQRAERELADTHRVLMETSRQAGMAEVATGVLHNVGNVLNSVNVSVNCITDLVAK